LPGEVTDGDVLDRRFI